MAHVASTPSNNNPAWFHVETRDRIAGKLDYSAFGSFATKISLTVSFFNRVVLRENNLPVWKIWLRFGLAVKNKIYRSTGDL